MNRWTTALILLLSASPVAQAAFTIHGARIAEGDLWVIGEVAEPDTVVVSWTTDSKRRLTAAADLNSEFRTTQLRAR